MDRREGYYEDIGNKERKFNGTKFLRGTRWNPEHRDMGSLWV